MEAILALLANNWKPLLIAICVAALYAGGVYQGNSHCELSHKAAMEQAEAQHASDLQKAIDEHIAMEKTLQAEAQAAHEENRKLIAAQAVLRKQGEAIIEKNSSYSTCIVPSDGVQYIRSHH